MQKNNQLKKSWSWLAFLFTPLWLGYNGMYWLYTLNLFTYLVEIFIGYVLNVNEINFGMVGVLPTISSIIFGLYGKSLRQNLEDNLSKKGKKLEKSWLALIGVLFISAIAFGAVMYLISFIDL